MSSAQTVELTTALTLVLPLHVPLALIQDLTLNLDLSSDLCSSITGYMLDFLTKLYRKFVGAFLVQKSDESELYKHHIKYFVLRHVETCLQRHWDVKEYLTNPTPRKWLKSACKQHRKGLKSIPDCKHICSANGLSLACSRSSRFCRQSGLSSAVIRVGLLKSG